MWWCEGILRNNKVHDAVKWGGVRKETCGVSDWKVDERRSMGLLSEWYSNAGVRVCECRD